MTAIRTISPTVARRLAITRQRLAGPLPPAGSDTMFEVVRDLGCLQLDPISVVARSHLLVLWSRLGSYDRGRLDALLWDERRLFEYWAHQASIVLTEDYPVHAAMMRDYAAAESARGQRRAAWVEENAALRDHILAEITARGPLPSRAFEDRALAPWHSTGWTSGRNANQMLNYLWLSGVIMVAGRAGIQKLWDLTERLLPDWTPRDLLDERAVVTRAAQSALRALGVATPAHIQHHYTRGRYPGLPAALAALEAGGQAQRVAIAQGGAAWPGNWYIHTDDLAVLDRLEAGAWQPRTTLLSPFDNLIYDRTRTEKLFDFAFRMEIYVPPALRRHGYYVLPILHGDRLIGRIDPVMDRKTRRLTVNAVHAEPDAPLTDDTARAVAGAVENLAAFLGATDIVYGERIPSGWSHISR